MSMVNGREGLIELLAGLLERSGTRTDRWSIWHLRQSLFHVIILQWNEVKK